MNILDLQKKGLVELNIVDCNRNEYIYNELKSLFPDLISISINFWKSNDFSNYEKLYLTNQLLNRNGMSNHLETKYGKIIPEMVSFFSSTLNIIKGIDESISVKVVNEKIQIFCDNLLIKEIDDKSLMDIFKEILEIKEDNDLNLFIVLTYFLDESMDDMKLAWAAQFLNKEDIKKIKNYRKENPMTKVEDFAETILEEAKRRRRKN